MLPAFSKWPREKKIQWILKDLPQANHIKKKIQECLHPQEHIQKNMEGLSENVLTNFILPYSVAPHFLINQKIYHVPLVTEESSVVAALAKAAKFWYTRGGFRTSVLSTQKEGQIHFRWYGDIQKLYDHWQWIKIKMLEATQSITEDMKKRGGGIQTIQLKEKKNIASFYYQIHVTFDTCDAMGANFINTCLEAMAKACQIYVTAQWPCIAFEIIMSILSNHAPHCMVISRVSCAIKDLGYIHGIAPPIFAEKFALATHIAHHDIYRAATHNKGILNGIDALALATGNDCRAIETAVHVYAAAEGCYQGLTKVSLEEDVFTVQLKLPLMIGVVGGMTRLHPLVETSLRLLQKPNAIDLMQIMAAVGLASHFSALTALITTGIQQGHMRMHLHNLLSCYKLTLAQREKAMVYFQNQVVSTQAVKDYIRKNVS